MHLKRLFCFGYLIRKLNALHLLVQGHHAVDQGFRARRAARHLDIHRHNHNDTQYQGLVIKDACAGRTVTHSDNPLGLGHLII